MGGKEEIIRKKREKERDREREREREKEKSLFEQSFFPNTNKTHTKASAGPVGCVYLMVQLIDLCG
jgi:hypothetical protein